MSEPLAMPDLPHDDPPRTFRAATLDEALAEARQEMGDVELIEARRVRRGGLGGFFATDLGIEIVVVASSATDQRVADVVEMFPSPDRQVLAEAAPSRLPAPNRDDMTEPTRRSNFDADPDATTVMRRPATPLADPDATRMLRRPTAPEAPGEVALDRLIAGATERDRRVAAEAGVFRPAIAGVLDELEAERAEAEAFAAIDAAPKHPFAAVLGAEMSEAAPIHHSGELSLEVPLRHAEPLTPGPVEPEPADVAASEATTEMVRPIETSVFGPEVIDSQSSEVPGASMSASLSGLAPPSLPSPPPPPPAGGSAVPPPPAPESTESDGALGATAPNSTASDRPTAEEAVPDDLLDSVFSLGSRGEGSFSRITLTVDRHDGNSVTVAADFAGDERG
ncbi:MAG: hypothetical protein AB8G26_12940 [Ilumatobacter sp.]